MKKTLISLTLLTFTFLSCSEDQSTSSSVNADNKINIKSGSTIQDAADRYAVNMIDNQIKLIDELKNQKVTLSPDFHTKLEACRNNTELKNLFNAEGFENSDVIVNLLENSAVLANSFVTNNPSFLDLSEKEQDAILEPSLGLAMGNHPIYFDPDYNDNTPLGCAHEYNKDIRHCNRDFGICGSAAVIAAAGGIWPGVVAAAYCMVDFTFCKSDAKEDYDDCMNDGGAA